MILSQIASRTIKYFFQYIISFSLLLFACCTGYAQVSQRDSVIKKLKQIAVAYKTANHLSFDVKYLYSKEGAPGTYLDSLSGSFKIQGNHYAYTLDSTDFLGNDSLNLVVFNEDKLIYVNNPSNVQSANPLAMIDSVTEINQYSNAALSLSAGILKVTIDFNAGYMFKKAVYYIDTSTSLITKMIATIQSAQMYDPAVKPMFDTRVDYGILEVQFLHYKTNQFADSAFSEAKYILKNGNQYTPSAAYSSYQVMNASIR